MSNATLIWSTWFAAALITVAAWGPSASAKAGTSSDLCERSVLHQERVQRIPSRLLHAISIAESGRWNRARKENTAWPWTVTSGGKGQYYPTKIAAIRAVRRLQRKGVRNIDVGCMQVNLRYHPTAFKSLEEAFDPAANARYAGRFLAQLHQEKRSWVQAVKHYHSATRSLHMRYRAKVYKIWRAERRKARDERNLKQRENRRRNAARYSRAERILAQNSVSTKRLDWLDRTTRRLFNK